jgi:hypothetical protein
VRLVVDPGQEQQAEDVLDVGLERRPGLVVVLRRIEHDVHRSVVERDAGGPLERRAIGMLQVVPFTAGHARRSVLPGAAGSR